MIKERTHLNKEVARIYWKQRPTDSSGVAPQAGQVLVRCNDGTLYEADHVIVTTSLGVLKDKVHSMFRPSLPDNKLIAIKVRIFTIRSFIFNYQPKLKNETSLMVKIIKVVLIKLSQIFF